MDENFKPKGFGVTKELFKKWRSPRFGERNPEKINSDVWQWLAKSKLSGYSSTQKMNGPDPYKAGPTWSFDRFGQSQTKLPDGRIVFISGEHEDHYDPDFYIYNDIAVLNKVGDFEFYCYPESAFAPTDFHTATLVDNKIIIIGTLGYQQNRIENHTPVYILNLENMAISVISTTGDQPGWIHDHSASLNTDTNTITLDGGLVYVGHEQSLRENHDAWSLNLQTWQWNRLTDKQWTTWELQRADQCHNHLWELRQALWCRGVNWKQDYEKYKQEFKTQLGHQPDLNILDSLYHFEFTHSPANEVDDEHNTFWITVDGVRVRFYEDSYFLRFTVEGELDCNKVKQIKDSLISKLSQLENSPYTAQRY